MFILILIWFINKVIIKKQDKNYIIIINISHVKQETRNIIIEKKV
jgi:hypothetical protein